MKNRKKPLKWICYGIIYIILLVLQTSFFSWMPIMGGAPVMPACFAAALGAYEGPKSGAGFGFFCGVVADSLMGSAGFFTLMCTLVGFAAGLLTENFLRRSGGMAYICAVGALFVTEVLRMVYYLFFNSLSSAGIWSSLFPELVYSAILAVPCLFFLSLIHKRFAVRY